MSNDYKVVPSSEVHPVQSTRKSPMEDHLAPVEGDYWTMGNVAAPTVQDSTSRLSGEPAALLLMSTNRS